MSSLCVRYMGYCGRDIRVKKVQQHELPVLTELDQIQRYGYCSLDGGVV